MPPVLLEAKENIEILEKDEMLSGFSTSKHLFIDISLGVPIRVCVYNRMIGNKDADCAQDRLIVARDTDGTLRTATLDEKRRMRQIYFPIPGRELIMPKMFEEEHLEVRRKNSILFVNREFLFSRKFQKNKSINLFSIVHVLNSNLMMKIIYV